MQMINQYNCKKHKEDRINIEIKPKANIVRT